MMQFTLLGRTSSRNFSLELSPTSQNMVSKISERLVTKTSMTLKRIESGQG